MIAFLFNDYNYLARDDNGELLYHYVYFLMLLVGGNIVSDLTIEDARNRLDDAIGDVIEAKRELEDFCEENNIENTYE